MKSILISIKPEYVAKILNGEKTIEIRKTAPKCELPIDVYIYCTKSKPYITYVDGKPYVQSESTGKGSSSICFNGKIVAKFTLREVEKLKIYVGGYIPVGILHTDSIPTCSLMEKESCLSMDEIWKYTKRKGYAWHISDLQIFDNPKELSEFFYGFKLKNNGVVMFDYVKKALVQRTLWGYEYSYLIKKAPQSWCYVEENKQ